MTKRAVKAKKFLADLRAGMADNELMEKYKVTLVGLDSVFRKLMAAGLITRAELAARQAAAEELDAILDLDEDALAEHSVCAVEGTVTFPFSGRVECIDILDYIQCMLMDGRKTVLNLKAANGQSGTVFIDGGNIIHAESDGVKGEEAFYACVQLPGGEFEHVPWSEPEDNSITKMGTLLLLEGARRRDEAREG